MNPYDHPPTGALDLGPVLPTPLTDWNERDQKAAARRKARVKRKKNRQRLMAVRRKRARIRRW